MTETERKVATDAYRVLLARHDWSYDRSDDHSAWRRGQEARERLRELQPVLDPDHSIWNSIAPEGYRYGA